MAYVKKGEIRDGVSGAWIEFGQFTKDPASIAAAAQGIETETITGANTGDMVFVNMQAGPLMSIMCGAKITAADTISIYLNNAYDSSTAVDIGSKVFDVVLIHLS